MIKNILAILLVFFTISVFGQSDMGKAGNARTQEVVGGIYLYQNRGGNILIAEGKEGVLLVNSQFDDLAEDLIDEVEKLTKKNVHYLINSNHREENTGGNAKLVEQGALVFAQDNTRKRLVEMIQNADPNQPKINEAILPVITFDQGMNFYFNRQKVVLTALKGGHSDGDAVVYFTGSNVIHTGDAFVHNTYPFFDTESGGSYQGYLEGLGKIRMMIDENTKVMPGEGPMAEKKDVEYLERLLSTVFKRVRTQYLKEKTLSEIQAMPEITAEYDQKGFGDGSITREQFIEQMYNTVHAEYDREEIEKQKERYREAQKRANLLDPKYKGGGEKQ